MGIANPKSVKLKTYGEYQSPNRNQIDYICIKADPNDSIYNSRSNGGTYAK